VFLFQTVLEILEVFFVTYFNNPASLVYHPVSSLYYTYFATPAFSLINSTDPAYNILLSWPHVGGLQYNNTNGVFNLPSDNLNGYDKTTNLGLLSGNSSVNSSILSMTCSSSSLLISYDPLSIVSRKLVPFSHNEKLLILNPFTTMYIHIIACIFSTLELLNLNLRSEDKVSDEKVYNEGAF